MVTLEYIQAEIESIKAIQKDPECAHLSEDALWQSVLQAIADGAENPQELAAAALESTKLGFDRWYA